MGFCYQLSYGCCGCPVGHVVGISFVSFFIQGIYCCAFVFSNHCYPPFYYVDYVYGGSGGALILISIVGIFIANLKNMQPIRATFAAIVVLTVLINVVFTYYYTIDRWDDVVVTAITYLIRSPEEKDFSDFTWHAMTIMDCVMVPFFLVDLVYIVSYLCNDWESHLFQNSGATYGYTSPFLPFIAVPPAGPPPGYTGQVGGQYPAYTPNQAPNYTQNQSPAYQSHYTAGFPTERSPTYQQHQNKPDR